MPLTSADLIGAPFQEYERQIKQLQKKDSASSGVSWFQNQLDFQVQVSTYPNCLPCDVPIRTSSKRLIRFRLLGLTLMRVDTHALHSIWQVFFFAPQATEEELEASKSKHPPSSKCTAAKAAAKTQAAPGKRSKAQSAEQGTLPTPGNTPVKSPPTKKPAKKDKVNTTGVARRLSFKSPDPDPSKQIDTLQEAPVLLVISKVAVLAHERMILVILVFHFQ